MNGYQILVFDFFVPLCLVVNSSSIVVTDYLSTARKSISPPFPSVIGYALTKRAGTGNELGEPSNSAVRSDLQESERGENMVKVSCLGAAGSVTGSNFLVETSRGRDLVVDCGLFQGGREMELRNREEWGYDPKEIKTLILTHAHIDHSGRIPKMVRDGFRGKIITSLPTAELCEIMLLDAAHIQEMDAEWRSKRNKRRARQVIEPLYTTRDAENSLRHFAPIELDRVVDVGPGIKARLRNAGHVLGSSIVELWIEDEGKETKIVFSGDLGKHDQLIVEDPFEVLEADYLFIESTYGNRRHRTFEESKKEFLGAIKYAMSNNEKVIIPAFALERSQEILYVLGEFFRSGQLPNIPVYLDSPLAIKATEIFRRNRAYYDEAARAIVGQGFDPFDMPNLKLTRTTKESMEINASRGPGIVISANGMCTAGRIKHHLKHNLWRPGSAVVIVGFQAQGSLGRRIVDGEKNVTVLGERIAVKAKVFTIGGLSSHADQADLLAWVGHFTQKSRPKVFTIHGEPTSSEALAQEIRTRFGLDAYVPQRGESLVLEPGEGVPEIIAPPVLVPVDRRKRTADLIAEMEAEMARLKRHLVELEQDLSEGDMDRLQDIRDDLKVVAVG
ncbi:MAG: MBL fold metallo-hydrolase [Pseudomonadota bacterium]